MKRYLNYLLLASNFIIAIVIAILIAVFLKEFNNANNANISIKKLYEDLYNYVWLVAFASIASVGLFVTYFFLVKRELQNSFEKINPRLAKGLIYSGLISFVNYIIPIVLASIAIVARDKQVTTIMLWCAFGISGLVGLIISGFTSYFNLRISWANVKREQLKAEALEENEHKTDATDEIAEKLVKARKAKANDTSAPKIDKPTSGSF